MKKLINKSPSSRILNQFISLLGLLALINFTACKVNNSSADKAEPGSEGDVNSGGVNSGSGANAGAGANSPKPATPFDFPARWEDTGAAREYKYAELLNTTQSGQVELRLFTKAPRGFCNSTTLTDSSSYQSDFDYVAVRLNSQLSTVQDVPQAKSGSRGDTFPTDRILSGSVRLSQNSTTKIYSGYLDLQGGNQSIRGNFEVMNCWETSQWIRRMGLDNQSQDITLVDTASGKNLSVSLTASYQASSSNPYKGYETSSDTWRFRLSSGLSSSDPFELSFYGLQGGQYIGLGNSYGNENSPGPGIGYLQGNTLVLNSERLPNMTDSSEFSNSPEVQIELSPTSNLRKIQVKLRNRIFEGYF